MDCRLQINEKLIINIVNKPKRNTSSRKELNRTVCSDFKIIKNNRFQNFALGN